MGETVTVVGSPMSPNRIDLEDPKKAAAAAWERAKAEGFFSEFGAFNSDLLTSGECDSSWPT